MDEERQQQPRAADAGGVASTMDNHDVPNYSQTTTRSMMVRSTTPTPMDATTPRSKKRSRYNTSSGTGSFLPTTVAVAVAACAAASFFCCIQPVHSQTPAFTRAAACENEPSVRGYSTIADLNADMKDELELINVGTTTPTRTADDPYILTLCPGVTFDMRGPTPITPVLNNVHVVCGGSDNQPEESCILDRSAQQILIEDIDTTIDGFRFESFTITGVTFNDFRRGTSTSITASGPGIVTFNNCIWQNWDADNVVDVSGSNSISVEVNGGTIVNGDALEGFKNPGGVVMIDRLNVTNTGFRISMVTTSGGGETVLSNTEFEGGSKSVSSILVTSGGSSALVENVTVNAYQQVQENLFYATDAGTTMDVVDLQVSNIAFDREWTVVLVEGGATGTVRESTFDSLQQLQYVLAAKFANNRESTLVAEDVTFTNNVGRAGISLISGIVGSEGNFNNFDQGSFVDIQRATFRGNSDFVANVAGAYGGDMRVRQACFEDNSQLAVIISGRGGTVTARNNFASGESTQVCTGRNGRIFDENTESLGCFTSADDGDGGCTGNCLPGADDSTVCLAQVLLSNEPSEVPSVAPTTTAPSSSPTTLSLSETPTQAPTETDADNIFETPSLIPTISPNNGTSSDPPSVSQNNGTSSEPPSVSQNNGTSSEPQSFRPTGPPVDFPTQQPVPIATSPSPVVPPITLGPIPLFPVEVTLPPFPPQVIPGVTRPPTSLPPSLTRPTVPRVTPPPRISPSPTRGAPVFQPTRPNLCPPDYVYVGGKRKGKGNSKSDGYDLQMIYPYSQYRYECQKMKKYKIKSAKSKIKRSKKGKGDGFHGVIGGRGQYGFGWDPMGGAQGAYRDYSFGGTTVSHGKYRGGPRNLEAEEQIQQKKEQRIEIGPSGEILVQDSNGGEENRLWEDEEGWDEDAEGYQDEEESWWDEPHIQEVWYEVEEVEEGSSQTDPELHDSALVDQEETSR